MSSANDTQVLSELGMSPAAPSLAMPAPPAYLAVQLDGRVVGAMPAALAGPAVSRLRAIKAARLLEDDRLPPTNDIIELEVPSSLCLNTLHFMQHIMTCIASALLRVSTMPFFTNGLLSPAMRLTAWLIALTP